MRPAVEQDAKCSGRTLMTRARVGRDMQQQQQQQHELMAVDWPTTSTRSRDYHIPSSQTLTCEIVWDCASPHDRRHTAQGPHSSSSSTPSVADAEGSDPRSSSVKRHLRTTPRRNKSGLANKAKKKLHSAASTTNSTGSTNAPSNSLLLSLPPPFKDGRRKPRTRGLFFKCDLGTDNDVTVLHDKEEDSLNSDGEDLLLALSPIEGLDELKQPRNTATSFTTEPPTTTATAPLTTTATAPTTTTATAFTTASPTTTTQHKTPTTCKINTNSSLRVTPTNHNPDDKSAQKDQQHTMNQSFSYKKTPSDAGLSYQFESFSEDEFFYESVIQSTQAIEEALFDKSKNKFVSPANVNAALSKVGLLGNRRDDKYTSSNNTSPLSQLNTDKHVQNRLPSSEENNSIIKQISTENNSTSCSQNISLSASAKQCLVKSPSSKVIIKEASKVASLAWSSKSKSEDFSIMKRDNCSLCFKHYPYNLKKLSTGSYKCTCDKQSLRPNKFRSASSTQLSSHVMTVNNIHNAKEKPPTADRRALVQPTCSTTASQPSVADNLSSVERNSGGLDLYDDFDMDDNDWDFVSQVEDEYISSQTETRAELVPLLSASTTDVGQSAQVDVDHNAFTDLGQHSEGDVTKHCSNSTQRSSRNSVHRSTCRTTLQSNSAIDSTIGHRGTFPSSHLTVDSGFSCSIRNSLNPNSSNSIYNNKVSTDVGSNTEASQLGQPTTTGMGPSQSNSHCSLTMEVKRKCTPAEIEEKRVQALEKRKAIVMKRELKK